MAGLLEFLMGPDVSRDKNRNTPVSDAVAAQYKSLVEAAQTGPADWGGLDLYGNKAGLLGSDFSSEQDSSQSFGHSVGSQLREAYDTMPNIPSVYQAIDGNALLNRQLIEASQPVLTDMFEGMDAPVVDLPDMTVGDMFQKVKDGAVSPEEQVAIEQAKPVVKQAQATGVPNPETLPLDPAKAAVESNRRLKEQGDIAMSSAPKEAKTAWDNFSSKVDLFTMGAALMASSGNGKGFGANLGTAILYGQKTVTDAAELARKSDLDERKVAATEMAAQAAETRAGRPDPTKIPTPNKALDGIARDVLRQQGTDVDNWDEAKSADYFSRLSVKAQEAMQMPAYRGIPAADIIERLIQIDTANGFLKSDWWNGQELAY